MSMPSSSRARNLLRAALMTAGIALSTGAQAQSDAPAHPQIEYQKQRALCNSGRSAQDRETCLREAAAAYAESKRGTQAGGDSGEYERNALRRCEMLPERERESCRIRMRAGATSGSVEQGAIYRELREIIPAPAASAPAPAASPSGTR